MTDRKKNGITKKIQGWAKWVYIIQTSNKIINNARINCFAYNCEPTFAHPIYQRGESLPVFKETIVVILVFPWDYESRIINILE